MAEIVVVAVAVAAVLYISVCANEISAPAMKCNNLIPQMSYTLPPSYLMCHGSAIKMTIFCSI